MQGYTNGVSIFQRDFAVKQDYPEIINIQKSSSQKSSRFCRRNNGTVGCHGNETEVPGNKDIKNQTSFIQVLLDSIEKRMSIARELAHWTSVPGAAANR